MPPVHSIHFIGIFWPAMNPNLAPMQGWPRSTVPGGAWMARNKRTIVILRQNSSIKSRQLPKNFEILEDLGKQQRKCLAVATPKWERHQAPYHTLLTVHPIRNYAESSITIPMPKPEPNPKICFVENSDIDFPGRNLAGPLSDGDFLHHVLETVVVRC